uniref:HTH CENPB-type domain-containing protein n=1 Tax=Scylla olivacea TaxID=85551 RepID=A0A0N7ZB11_SCYOL
MSPRACLPLSVKLKLLADQEKGFGPKCLMKKYNIKKSTYYRILSEKEAIRNFALRSEFKNKLETDEEEGDNHPGNVENEVKQEIKDENQEERQCDTPQSFEGVNKAVMQWYSEKEAEGVQVNKADIDEAAEQLAQKLGFTDFKLNSSGWPLRFRKAQSIVKTPSTENVNDEEKETPKPKVRKDLRIQDQITAFQRLQAGETAQRIADDLGVSKSTILRVKKRLKDTLFTPSLDPKYQIRVESLKTRKKNESAVKEKLNFCKEENSMSETSHDSDSNKESLWASIEQRKRLRCIKNGMSNKERGLNQEEKIEAIAQYKSGITVKEIARNFGVSISTIQRVKKKFSKSHKISMKNYLKLEQKVNVLERLDEGESIVEIADDLRVNETTIRSIKKNKIKIMNVYKASLSSIGFPLSPPQKIVSVNEKIEERLLAWINDMKQKKMPLSTAMIQKKALMIQVNIAQEEGSSSSQTFTPTMDWLDSFKRQHDIQQIIDEDSESGSDSYDERYCKAGPKSMKRRIIGHKKGHGPFNSAQHTSAPPEVAMKLSQFAAGLREMYLDSSLPADPYRCNVFTPRVLLIRSEEEEDVIKKYTTPDVKNEPVSEEETWLTAHTNPCSDSDWEEENWDTHSLTEVGKSKDSVRKKRKKTSSEYNKKRRRLSDGDNSDDKSVADYNRSNFVSVPIKQEPQSSLDSVHSSVPMAVLPAGSTYVPPLPMFQMQAGGLTVFMPESQQMMMQHPINYPHNNSSELFMNQQQIRGRTVASSPSCQFSDIQSEASVEPNIRQDNENMIVMPLGRDLCEPEKSRQFPLSHPDSVVCDSLEKAKRDRAAAIAESIGNTVEGSSNKMLSVLTFKLLELNNKNLICDERIEKAREDYEKTVAHIEAEKKINDKEIDKVLAAIQEWKEAKSHSST